MKKDSNIYSLRSEDLSNVGGPMGNNFEEENWTKYFSSLEFAKTYAEKDYKKNGGKGKIKWEKGSSDDFYLWTSGDLLFVGYDIEKVKVEK